MLQDVNMKSISPYYIKKEYPVYTGNECVYNLDEIRRICFWIQGKQAFISDARAVEVLNRFIEPIKQNNTTYYMKKDIDKFVDIRKNSITIKELFAMSEYKQQGSLIKALYKLGVEVFLGKTLPFNGSGNGTSFIRKSDYEKALTVISNNSRDGLEAKYYTRDEAAEILGVSASTITARHMAKQIEYIKKSNNQWWFLKKDVDYCRKIKDETVALKDVYHETGLSMRACSAAIKNSDFDYYSPNEWPFNGSVRVHMEAIEYVKRTQKIKEEFNKANKFRRYEILKEISVSKKNEKAIETLKDLDEYIETKLSNTDSQNQIKRYYNTGAKLYSFFNMALSMEFKKYHVYPDENAKLYNDAIENLFSIFLMNDDNSIYDFSTFIKFYNYLLDKYELKGKFKKINIREEDLYSVGTKNVKPYTLKQFANLFVALFNQIYESKSLFTKVITNKTMATTWLYMALHFCLGWRKGDIVTIEHPDLNIIGFSTGKDFLEFLTEPTKFTEEMGFAICSNVKILVEGLGRRTEKTNEELVFEIGRILSKPIGMMLAVCEAHRLINNQKYLMVKSTVERRFNHKALLGHRYEEIFNGETFSNRRANKTYMNYIVSKTDEVNNGIGFIIAAIIRSHKLNENLIPIATQKYINREVDRDISSAAIELWDTGGFGFVKHEMLSLLDKNFDEDRLAEKRKKIRKINISPLGINEIAKNVGNQATISRKITEKIIANLSKDKILFKDTIVNLTRPKSTGKHKNVKCLLRAMPLKSILEFEQKVDFKNMATIRKVEDVCIYPDTTHCDGCPMMIAQIYYLFELKKKINDILNKIEDTTEPFELTLLNKIFVEGYTPILEAIIDEIGINVVKSIIPLDNFKTKYLDLKSEGKLI